ncbi:hypothetical protein [Trebonia sp.]|uniref:hypothetical protein n=1 Tax=Trebonia sp. TaxID=2767075 RepID=UPI003C785B34
MRVVRRGRDRGADVREAQVGVWRRARARVLAHTTGTSVPDRDTPLRAVRPRFADRAVEMLGPSPVAPFSIPVFRTGAADSLAEIRAAHPPPAG